MEYELKTDPGMFDDVVKGNKRFEIRYDDRGYAEGDTLKLRKTKFTGAAMKNGAPLEYVGPPLYVIVTYVMRGPLYGLAKDWVIMSFTFRDGCA